MKIKELLAELTYAGSPCTKDCGGHNAGYNYALKRKQTVDCTSGSASFNKGCAIAAGQLKTNKVTRPTVRGAGGRYAKKPV
jgi:hypothetical protein